MCTPATAEKKRFLEIGGFVNVGNRPTGAKSLSSALRYLDAESFASNDNGFNTILLCVRDVRCAQLLITRLYHFVFTAEVNPQLQTVRHLKPRPI